MSSKFGCSIFHKGTQKFYFIKHNEIRKLADEVTYITQISTM